MNALKRLKIELDGIETILNEYSDTAIATTIIPKLREEIDAADKDGIIYCVDEMIKWYENNISDICNNEWCFNDEAHKRNYQLLEEVKNGLEKLDDSYFNVGEKKKETDNSPLVFLSHCSKDKKYADALRKFLVDLGLKDDQLIYTSHPLHKIPLGKNIYEYLRENINKNIFMIILWSDDYLDNPTCLCEMGAAWVTQCDYTNIYVPKFSFGNPKYRQCAVDTSKMGAVLNGDSHCKQSMIELKNTIQGIFSLENDESRMMFLIDEFIEEIQR